MWFLDSADVYGLGQISLDTIGWATGFADFDNDGWRELWIVNGSTFEQTENHRYLKPQSAFLFSRTAIRTPSASAGPRSEHGRAEEFVNLIGAASETMARPRVGRGGAQADLDGDGRLDLVWVVHGGDALVLQNVSEPAGHWLRVVLRQSTGNRFALGARVYLTAGGKTFMDEVGCSSSYLSQHDLTLHFGLGKVTSVELLRIVWPDRSVETYDQVPVDQTVTYVRGAK